MAAYSYTFTGSNGAAWEAGWHKVDGVGTVDIQSNKGRVLTSATAYAYAGSYFDGVTIDQDTDIYVDAVITTVTASEFYAAVNLRASPVSGGSSYQFTDVKQHNSWHCLFVGTATSGYTVLYRISNSGAATFLVGGADKDFVQGDTLHMHFSPSGQRFRCKYWRNATSEPAAWDIDYLDTSAPTGAVMSLMVRAGNNASADRWDWDSLSIGATSTNASAGVATGSALGQSASAASRKNVDAPVAVGVGTAHFESAGGSSSVTIEAVDSLDGHGFANDATIGIGKSPTPTTATGAGVAHDATIGVSGHTSPAATVAVSAGAAVAPSRSVKVAATHAASSGSANAATVTTTTGSAGVLAECATGIGSSGGSAYLLDHNGDPILDENSQPIGDGAGISIAIAPTSSLTKTGAANTPQTAVAPQAGAGVSVGTAPQPAINTAGGSTTTNVNAATASATGSANAATTLVSPAAGHAAGTGAANTPTGSFPTAAAIASAVGAANGAVPSNVSANPAGVGVAYNAQANVDSNNFVPAAPIPIFATAADANVGIYVYPDGITIVAVADTPASSEISPGQLITLHDSGHTVTLKER